MRATRILAGAALAAFLFSVANIPPTLAEDTAEEKGVVNINTATEEELTLLPGIGKKTAQAIIDYREKEGKFESAEDIIKVKGVGKKTFEKIKDMIVVEGETTLAPKGKK